MFRVAPVSLSSFLCLNPCYTVLHGWPPSSPSKPPWLELFKLITSNHAPLSKPSQNQIMITTTAKIKSQQKPRSPPNHKSNHICRNQNTHSQNNQNHKMKTLKVNPLLKKHILVLLLYFRRRIILLN